ncbi:ABC transporter ATP-binding protein [Paraburkholderia sp. SUR17]|jgi:putative ABC transport system ATP-binding protein|uniref:ABC transporter ATP-binding protein n=1 Tax=Paraburkholderia sp. SUR17 TaxID=3034358 RepID=UPI002407BE2A|nr:ABC transporter ATP-binding protein [Paraburkholderia sp. SUR17]WEY42096.1 ABC transporter ATP-binding protein [Paraburkholderia sp. SUR17]
MNDDPQRTASGAGFAVVCEQLAKAYPTPTGSVPALRGVDLAVRTREVMFLVGPSGCGKTTLISIVAGVLRRDAGRCTIFDVDPESLPSAQATAFRRDHIGFVFQSYNLIPSLSVRDNVSIPLLLQRAKPRDAAKTAQRSLELVGLSDQADKMPSELSGGQQQRVAIARAIVHSPRLIVCDEPTSALDHTTGRDIMKLLRSLVLERGTTLIVVTHDRRIYEYADRIAEMDDGRITGIRASSSVIVEGTAP